jgi:Flp pilus assembly protein TadG
MRCGSGIGASRFGALGSWRTSPEPGRQGFALVAFSLALLLILRAVGLSFDVGRMYITRSEAQAFCDSAAITAALKLNGTGAGLQAARAAASAVVKGWQFGTTAFPFNANTDLSFAKTINDTEPWPTNPSPATGYVIARVNTRVSLPLYLLPIVVGSTTSSIAASGAAKQMVMTTPGVGNYAPFTPFGAPIMSPRLGSPDPTGGEPIYYNDPFNLLGAEVRPLQTPVTYQQGKLYNVFWPNDSNTSNHWNDSAYVCNGNQYPALLSLTTASGLSNSNRGYIYNQASVVNATIVAGILPAGYPLITTGMDIAPNFLAVSSGVMENNLTNGLGDRSATDSDSTSASYAAYAAGGRGNGQRVMLMPVNSGQCGPSTFSGNGPNVAYTGTNTCIFPLGDGSTTTAAVVPSYTVIGWGRFFLLTSDYYYHINGNKGVCAEYIGPGMVQGGGAGTGSGLYAVRIVL